jgi:hypothetical protein
MFVKEKRINLVYPLSPSPPHMRKGKAKKKKEKRDVGVRGGA